MLGIHVPPRAAWLRVLVAEQARVAHHLLWLAATAEHLGLDAGAAFSARESILDSLEQYSGARMHPMVARIGGLRADVDQAWVDGSVEGLQCARAAGSELACALTAETHGIAKLPLAAAWAYSASGPVARASGLGLDLRLDRPDEVYGELAEVGALTRVMRLDGDAAARFDVLAEEIRVSSDCVEVAAARLATIGGPVDVQLPKVVRVPEGHGYCAGENPSGVNGWYLVSRGGATPYRLKLRTASFNNAQALPEALAGLALEDLPVAFMSFLLVAGDVDK